MSENNLEGILSRHGLHKKDLQKECSREVVVRFAIEAHVDSKTLGQFLNYEEEWLEAIEREYENEGKRREVLLDVLGGQSRPSYLLLANTMCRKQRPDLVELLCNVLVQSTSKSESDGGGELQDSQVNQLCVRGKKNYVNGFLIAKWTKYQCTNLTFVHASMLVRVHRKSFDLKLNFTNIMLG